MDAYRSRHSSYYYNRKEHRSVISLSEKILSTPLFEWEINPFDPMGRDTFENGSVNSRYELCIQGTEFEFKYLNLLRNRFRFDDQFSLLCQDNVQFKPSHIAWSLGERIEKLARYNDFLNLGINLENDAILEETFEVCVTTSAELRHLESLLDESPLFSRFEDSTWSYAPHRVLGIKFVLRQIDLNQDLRNGMVLLQVDDDSLEYVDIYRNNESKMFFHLWSCTSASFAQNVADFITYQYQIPRFAAFIESVYSFVKPQAKGPTDILQAAVQDACIKHPEEAEDKLLNQLVDFVCLNRINPVLEVVSPSPLNIRIGSSVRLQTRCYPKTPERDVKIYCRTSREQVVAVNVGPEYADIQALTVGDVELYFFDGISDRNFHSIRVNVVDPVYCKQIVIQPETVTMPTRATADVSLFYEPKEALDAPYLKWTSQNPDVAKINNSGRVASSQPGTTIITVQGEDVQTQFKVIVKPRIKSIEINQPRFEAYVNQLVPVSISTLPANCYDNRYSIHIQDPAVLQLNSQNKFVARSKGTTTVTVQSKAEPDIIATFEVKVDFIPEPKAPVIKQFYTLMILWLLLCWAAYLPLLIFAGQLYFAARAVSENKRNIYTVAGILLLQLFIQLFIL